MASNQRNVLYRVMADLAKEKANAYKRQNAIDKINAPTAIERNLAKVENVRQGLFRLPKSRVQSLLEGLTNFNRRRKLLNFKMPEEPKENPKPKINTASAIVGEDTPKPDNNDDFDKFVKGMRGMNRRDLVIGKNTPSHSPPKPTGTAIGPHRRIYVHLPEAPEEVSHHPVAKIQYLAKRIADLRSQKEKAQEKEVKQPEVKQPEVRIIHPTTEEKPNVPKEEQPKAKKFKRTVVKFKKDENGPAK